MATQKMTLAKLLRYKNNVVEAMAECQEQIQTSNSVLVGVERECDVKAEMARLDQLVAHLLEVKALKMRATAPIQWQIFELAELKSRIRFLEGLRTAHGQQTTYREDVPIVAYDAVIRRNDVTQEVRALRKKIDTLQTAIDAFNADTVIDVPVCEAMP
jgi:hypothetical protein